MDINTCKCRLTSQEVFKKELNQDTTPHPEPRLLRLKQIVPTIIPICKSAWWQGVKDGKYPRPIKLGSRTTVWRSQDIDRLIAGEVRHD